jgi:hypothetical protein
MFVLSGVEYEWSKKPNEERPFEEDFGQNCAL